jgi:hypothetical protein
MKLMKKIKKVYGNLLKRVEYYERYWFGGHLETIVVWFLIFLSVVYFFNY